MALAGTQAVPAGATSVTVTGVFSLPYQVALNANGGWAPSFGISAKTTSSFTVILSTPAPFNASIDWFIINIGQPIGFAEVEIANLALTHVSSKPIGALTEATTQARQANRYFWPSADEALKAHPWNFATRRSGVLAQADTPAFGPFAYAFQLPTEPYCLRVLSTSDDNEETGVRGEAWAVEGRQILTNLSELQVKYIARITDTGLWSSTFITAFSYLLASKLAYPITKHRSVAADMFSLWKDALKEARAENGLEGVPKRQAPSSLVSVRFSG